MVIKQQDNPDEKRMSANGQAGRVVVLGLGGGGGIIVHKLAQLSVERERIEVAAADTDLNALESLNAVVQVPLGTGWKCESGCARDPQLGEQTASASVNDLRSLIKGAPLLVVVACLGGGAGAGAANVVARLARDSGIPAFFVLTMPFSFEGHWWRQQAEQSLRVLRDVCEAVIVVENDLVFTTMPADTPVLRAFELIDETLARTIYGIASLAWADWLLKSDLAVIRKILQDNPEVCSVGVGSGNGENRWKDAVANFVDCPLNGGADVLRTATAAIVNVAAANDLSVAEMRECLTSLQQYFSTSAKVVIGACTSGVKDGEIKITGIVCRSSCTFNKGVDKTLQKNAESSDDGHNAKPDKAARSRDRSAVVTQAELPFQEQHLGLFSGVAPTRYNGENLDVPTFQRRGVHVDAGD